MLPPRNCASCQSLLMYLVLKISPQSVQNMFGTVSKYFKQGFWMRLYQPILQLVFGCKCFFSIKKKFRHWLKKCKKGFTKLHVVPSFLSKFYEGMYHRVSIISIFRFLTSTPFPRSSSRSLSTSLSTTSPPASPKRWDRHFLFLQRSSLVGSLRFYVLTFSGSVRAILVIQNLL